MTSSSKICRVLVRWLLYDVNTRYSNYGSFHTHHEPPAGQCLRVLLMHRALRSCAKASRTELRSGLRCSLPRASTGRDASEELPGARRAAARWRWHRCADGRADLSQLDEENKKQKTSAAENASRFLHWSGGRVAEAQQ